MGKLIKLIDSSNNKNINTLKKSHLQIEFVNKTGMMVSGIFVKFIMKSLITWSY